jgi:hypothetical protein
LSEFHLLTDEIVTSNSKTKTIEESKHLAINLVSCEEVCCVSYSVFPLLKSNILIHHHHSSFIMPVAARTSTGTRFLNHLGLLIASLLLDFSDYANAEVFSTIGSCRGVLWSHDFEGDCCALSDLPSGGCQLEVVGGVCNVTGPVWNTPFTSATRAVCPTTAYNALGGCKTNLDCPTKFCGSDGKCHDYSCETFFALSPVLDFDNDTKTELVCEPMEEDHHIAQYGCVETIGGLVPPARGIGIKANEVCSGISKNVAGDEIIAFECFQMMQGTNFSDFIDDTKALKESGDATCLAPLFWYSAAFGITESVNGALVQNKIAGDGSPPSLSFNEDHAYNAFYALITKTPTTTNGSPVASPTTGPPTPADATTTAAPVAAPIVRTTSGALGSKTIVATLVVAALSVLLMR